MIISYLITWGKCCRPTSLQGFTEFLSILLLTSRCSQMAWSLGAATFIGGSSFHVEYFWQSSPMFRRNNPTVSARMVCRIYVTCIYSSAQLWEFLLVWNISKIPHWVPPVRSSCVSENLFEARWNWDSISIPQSLRKENLDSDGNHKAQFGKPYCINSSGII